MAFCVFELKYCYLKATAVRYPHLRHLHHLPGTISHSAKLQLLGKVFRLLFLLVKPGGETVATLVSENTTEDYVHNIAHKTSFSNAGIPRISSF